MTDLANGAAWMKGSIIPIGEASIGVTDWGLTHSDITYDVVPVMDGGFFRLGDYLTRFEASMKSLRLETGMDRAAIHAALHEMVATSGLRDSYCAMVASRGSPVIPGSRDPRDCANHFYAWCVPFVHVIPQDVAARGARLKIGSTRRIPTDSVDPRVKNYHWGDFTPSLFEAKEAGFDNTVLLNHAGEMTEGPGFNIFAIIDGRVVTPEFGCLEGITRRTALEIARAEGLETEARALPLDEFMEAEEVFLTTSGGGVVPVVQVDERIFSNGAAGPLTLRLRDQYRAWMASPDYREEIAYAAEHA
ncbi:aminotransferase class IV [Rhodobacteraceae bacterium NNCM2]|nr:aminotransferase class IV [Coraliihabitans acroporae]